MDTRGAVKATESTDLEDWASERIHPNEACEENELGGGDGGEESRLVQAKPKLPAGQRSSDAT